MDEKFGVTPVFVATTLQEAGFQGKIEENNDILSVSSGADGWGFRIRFFNEPPTDPEQACDSFQFWAFWPLEADARETVLTVANEFNCHLRYATAFVTKSEDKNWAEITMDYFSPDGISQKIFISLLALFVDLRRIFYQKSKEALLAQAGDLDGDNGGELRQTTH